MRRDKDGKTITITRQEARQLSLRLRNQPGLAFLPDDPDDPHDPEQDGPRPDLFACAAQILEGGGSIEVAKGKLPQERRAPDAKPMREKVEPPPPQAAPHARERTKEVAPKPEKPKPEKVEAHR